jgi:hypothetical protein
MYYNINFRRKRRPPKGMFQKWGMKKALLFGGGGFTCQSQGYQALGLLLVTTPLLTHFPPTYCPPGFYGSICLPCLAKNMWPWAFAPIYQTFSPEPSEVNCQLLMEYHRKKLDLPGHIHCGCSKKWIESVTALSEQCVFCTKVKIAFHSCVSLTNSWNSVANNAHVKIQHLL